MDEFDRELPEGPPQEEQFVDMVVGPGRSSDNRRFGGVLAALRERVGLSRADAAAALGVSAEYLRLIEHGRRTPALKQMRRFLDVYAAEGEVESLQPGGDRVDLIFFPPRSDEPVIVEFRVKFESRIREPGRRAVSPARGVAARQEDPDLQRPAQGPSASHAADLGFVVSLLARADDSTIRKVRELLQDEVGHGPDTGA